MPTLKETLSETIKSSMKSGDKATLTYARNLHAAIRKKEVDERIDLDDAGVQKVAGSALKQRAESLEQFKAGGRADLVAQEEAEIAFLKKYIPAQLSDAEVRKLIADAVAESGAKDAKDLGKVMKVLQPKVSGKADGKLVSQLVREALGG
jgi:uncharacterized protein YqeY